PVDLYMFTTRLLLRLRLDGLPRDRSRLLAADILRLRQQQTERGHHDHAWSHECSSLLIVASEREAERAPGSRMTTAGRAAPESGGAFPLRGILRRCGSTRISRAELHAIAHELCAAGTNALHAGTAVARSHPERRTACSTGCTALPCLHPAKCRDWPAPLLHGRRAREDWSVMSPTSSTRGRYVLAVLAVCALLAMLEAAHAVLVARVHGEPVGFDAALLRNAPFWAALALLVPLIGWSVLRFPPHASPRRVWALHAAAGAAFPLVQRALTDALAVVLP